MDKNVFLRLFPNSNAFYSDLEITSNNEATSSVKTNDVPILPVISLPPVNNERRRRYLQLFLL